MVPKREEHTQREKAVAGSSGCTLVAQEIVYRNTFVLTISINSILMLLGITEEFSVIT